jgi:hypothetical protein
MILNSFLTSDPALKPTKHILSLQLNDEAENQRVPKGRYETTYRQEYPITARVCQMTLRLII